MSGDLVLLTGATGHLGFRVLLDTLQRGYQVRAAVRSETKAKIITSNPAFQALNKELQFSSVLVPDFLVPGAFDDAVKDVKYIIHVASPLASKDPPDGDYDKHFNQPAVKGTLGVFESAQKAGTVQRIVVTSSILSIVGYGSENGTLFTAETRQPTDEGPYSSTMHAYGASKIAAFNKAEEWMKITKPKFDAIHIHPGFIFGRDELCDSTSYFQTGTNKLPLNIAIGNGTKDITLPFSYAYLDDVARIHVSSLDPKVAGGQSFIVSNSGQDGESWDDVFPIIDKRYPDEVKKGVFKDNGAWSSVFRNIDYSKTEDSFKFKLASLEKSVKSVTDHYLELLRKERTSAEPAY